MPFLLKARTCAGLAAVLFGTVTVASSVSQADAPPVYLSPAISKFTAVDTQLTRFTAVVSCPSDPALVPSACPITLGLSWRAASLATYRAQGASHALSSTSATVPAGTTTTFTLAAPPSKLRNVTASRHVAAIVYATLTDLRTGGKVDQQQFAGPGGAFDRCPGPAYVPYRGGSVDVVERSASGRRQRTPVISGDLGVGESMQVGAQPIRFSILGVTYRVSARASFSRTCWGLTDYRRGQAAPTVVINSGSVHVSGRPYGAQIWVSVGTPEGLLGSRSQEPVVFTVSRNPRTQISTMRVARGHTTQVTPMDSPTRSPCTNGQALSVDRHGHIRAL